MKSELSSMLVLKAISEKYSIIGCIWIWYLYLHVDTYSLGWVFSGQKVCYLTDSLKNEKKIIAS